MFLTIHIRVCILLWYNVHINLEIVCAVNSVKYLYKYLEKGPDQCPVRLDVPDKEMREVMRCDEVPKYELRQYITASEGYWRIYNLPIQKKAATSGGAGNSSGG